MHIVLYLDDGIFVHKNREILIQQVKLIRSDLADAGWIVNLEKSVFQPNQVLTWLGFLLNFDRFQISVPLEKISRVSEKNFCLFRNILCDP